MDINNSPQLELLYQQRNRLNSEILKKQMEKGALAGSIAGLSGEINVLNAQIDKLSEKIRKYSAINTAISTATKQFRQASNELKEVKIAIKNNYTGKGSKEETEYVQGYKDDIEKLIGNLNTISQDNTDNITEIGKKKDGKIKEKNDLIKKKNKLSEQQKELDTEIKQKKISLMETNKRISDLGGI